MPPPSSSSTSPVPLSPSGSGPSNSPPQSPSWTSPSLAPPVALPRSRSVQFIESRSPMSRSQERHLSFQQAGESSADEITPIVGRERGGPKGYDATASEIARATGAEAAAASGPRQVDSRRRGSRGSRGSRGRRGSRGPKHTPGEEEDEVGGWWKNLVEKFGSVELENKGSVARDHLALERTFLAWLRTSLAFASIGIAVTQLFRLNTAISQREGQMPDTASNEIHLRHLGKPLGSIFLGVAIVVLIVGGRRYFEGQYWIVRGRFPASRGSVFLVSMITATLIVSSLVVVLVISPTSLRKR